METQSTTQTNTCSKCTYWKALSGDNGECRRQPPQAISFKVQDDVKFETRFPVTASDDWCGEFSAR
mgnify:CR=1 FL=1|jgi:hypothetical protein